MRLRLHWHRDPDWKVVGIHAYFRCRCGAVRVRHYAVNLGGPVSATWPDLVDRHGRRISDTGWVHMERPPRDPSEPSRALPPPPGSMWLGG